MQAPIQSTRAQSFDEIYGPPENFLEIEVRCDNAAAWPRTIPFPNSTKSNPVAGQEPANPWIRSQDVYRLRGSL